MVSPIRLFPFSFSSFPPVTYHTFPAHTYRNMHSMLGVFLAALCLRSPDPSYPSFLSLRVCHRCPTVQLHTTHPSSYHPLYFPLYTFTLHLSLCMYSIIVPSRQFPHSTCYIFMCLWCKVFYSFPSFFSFPFKFDQTVFRRCVYIHAFMSMCLPMVVFTLCT